MTRPTTLPERFRTVLVEGLVTGAAGRPGAPAEPSRLALSRGAAEAPAAGHSLAERTVVAALSGGLDSVALLHLLRFEAGAPLRLVAAHFDHAMRAESAADAHWVRGLCRAWSIPVRTERAAAAPASEAEARALRYDFLERVRREAGEDAVVVTAHHADDQAETVLFRVLRGTGGQGLAGITPAREPGVVRPLLGFWRHELEGYARAAKLSWREDATNADLGYARNALRRRLLPELERTVAPGARRALVRLAERAREDEAGWASLLPRLLAPLAVREEEGALGLDRLALLELHPAVRARVLRALAARAGTTLDEAATRRALRLAEAGASGTRVRLKGGLELRRELGRLVLGPELAPAEDRALVIPDSGPGSGEALLGGRAVAVAWGRAVPSSLSAEAFDAGALRFPLLVRARAPGDRIRLSAGSKSVKKLLLERRVPGPLRRRTPVLVDARGEVLWIPRVARAARPLGAEGTLTIGIG